MMKSSSTKGKGEEPTDFTESSFSGALEITAASPDTNEDEWEDNHSQERSSKGSRRYLLAVVLLAGLIAIGVGAAVLGNALTDDRKSSDTSASASAPADTPAPVACTKDAKMCPDGSSVGRDPENNCEFFSCATTTTATEPPQDETSIPKPEKETTPPEEPQVEPEDVTTTTEEPKPSITATTDAPLTPVEEATTTPTTEAPSQVVCERLTKMCTDLTTVTQSGPNCEFDPCPAGACMVDSFTCPDGITVVGRNPDNNCEFYDCAAFTDAPETDAPETEVPSQALCAREIKFCTDLTTVTRGGPDCEFAPCPAGACMTDTQECPDGATFVGRDPDNNCEFKPCP